jgi:S1-C subfamily serine protease
MLMIPETNHARGPRKVTLVLLVLVLILGAGFVYVAEAKSPTSSASATISSLQTSVSSLQSTNSELRDELSSLSSTATGASGGISGNTTVQGINAEKIYAAANASVVTLQGEELVSSSTLLGTQTETEIVLGSGFVTSYQGQNYIVTNNHVVDGVSNITATFSDGDSYPAKVLGTDVYSDLAVVSVPSAPSEEFVPLQIVSSSNVVVGQPVVVIGNPYGLSGSITFGIVSQLGRTIQEATTNGFSISDIIQFSAPINPGNSGGPLLDADGYVIGITTATVNGSQGVGFAIPSDTILKELSSLISTGSYDQHSYLGIETTDMNYQLAQASHTNVTYGVLIEQVVSGGPAAKAGLKAGTSTVTVDGAQYVVGGDIIISVNGTKIINGDALSSYLEEYTVSGQTVQLGIIRSGQTMTVDVALGTRPAP